MTVVAPKARVVVDARMLDTAGIGTYLAQVVPRVIERMPRTPFTVLGNESSLRDLLRRHPGVEVRGWRTPIYTVREQMEGPLVIPPDAALFWAPHFNIPLLWRGPLAVTVHDVAHLALPQSSPARTLYARVLFAAVRRRASVVLCDSGFTKREFVTRAGTPSRIVVCPLGVAERWFELCADPDAAESPYLLYVGNVKPHKNLGRLLDAFQRVAGRIPHRLVIVGRREGMRTVDRGVASLAEALGERVHFTGYVPPSALERLVADCDALVLPSLYEGFGLPPLEALACGRPVAVSNVASLPEVCGPYAEYFDPASVASIASALERVATRPPDGAAVTAKRRAWARRFDWDATAATIASELTRVLDHDSSSSSSSNS